MTMFNELLYPDIKQIGINVSLNFPSKNITTFLINY
jgi:hypothetical protein